MKAMLSALAIVALIATTHVAGDIDERPSWLGTKLSNPIYAEAINTGNIVHVIKVAQHDAIIFWAVRNGYDYEGGADHRCDYLLGIDFNGEDTTFCALILLAFKQMSNGSVVMVMRFHRYQNPEYQGRLEIHISEATGEAATPRYRQNTENFFTFIDFNRIANLNQNTEFHFHFTWLADLLKHGVVSASPTPVEEAEDGVVTYVSRPVHISAEFMRKLRSLFG